MAKGKAPTYRGTVTNESQEQIGKAALWKNENPKGERSPVMSGTVEINGAKYRVAFWEAKNSTETKEESAE